MDTPTAKVVLERFNITITSQAEADILIDIMEHCGLAWLRTYGAFNVYDPKFAEFVKDEWDNRDKPVTLYALAPSRPKDACGVQIEMPEMTRYEAMKHAFLAAKEDPAGICLYRVFQINEPNGLHFAVAWSVDGGIVRVHRDVTIPKKHW